MRGESETVSVWMSFVATPAAFSAAITLAMSAEFDENAADAVLPWVVTPKETVAVSGTATMLPEPETVTVRAWAGSAVPTACARSGSPTPANSEAATRAPARTRTFRSFISLYTPPPRLWSQGAWKSSLSVQERPRSWKKDRARA